MSGPIPVRPQEPRWWVSVDGQMEGPYGQAYIIACLNAGQITASALLCLEGATQWQPISAWPQFMVANPPQPPPKAETPFSFANNSVFQLDKTKPRRAVPMWSYWAFLILGFLVFSGVAAVLRTPDPKPLSGQQRQPLQPKTGSDHPAPVEPSVKSKQPAEYGFPIAESFTPVGSWVCERQTYRDEAKGVLIHLKLQFAKDGTYVLTKTFSGAGVDGNPEEQATGRWELSGKNLSLASPITLPQWIRTVKIEQQGLGGSAEHPSLNFKIAGHTWAFRRESKTPRIKYNFGLPPLDPVQLEPDSLDKYGPNYSDRVGILQTW